MRKQKKQSQDKTVCIRMTRDMAEMIEENAKLARISVSEYVRRCVRGDPIILHQEIPYDCSRLLEIYAPLPEISDQLNQVAKALNAGEKMTNERWRTVRNCIAKIYEIRGKQQKLLQSEKRRYGQLQHDLQNKKYTRG